MTTTAPERRPIVGLLIALAGLLAGISLIVVLVASATPGAWIVVITDAALFVAFLFLFIGRSTGMIARVFFLIAAIGWLLLAIGGAVTLGVLLTVGVILALAGTLIGGILAFTGKIFGRTANIVFLLAAIVVAIVLFNQLVPFLGGTIAIIVVALYALLLLVSGILIAARR
jgi:hypothetical protein